MSLGINQRKHNLRWLYSTKEFSQDLLPLAFAFRISATPIASSQSYHTTRTKTKYLLDSNYSSTTHPRLRSIKVISAGFTLSAVCFESVPEAKFGSVSRRCGIPGKASAMAWSHTYIAEPLFDVEIFHQNMLSPLILGPLLSATSCLSLPCLLC